MRAWLRRLWTGDDGHVYGVCADCSPFLDDEYLYGPFTRRQARSFARRHVARHPCGEANVMELRDGVQFPPPSYPADRVLVMRP